MVASEAVVSRVIAHFTKGSGTVSIKPQKRLTGSGASFIDCNYTLATTDSAAGSTAVTAGTTQTATAILDVDATACDIQFVITVSSGSVDFAAQPVVG